MQSVANKAAQYPSQRSWEVMDAQMEANLSTHCTW
jgi:hypothetical protein